MHDSELEELLQLADDARSLPPILEGQLLRGLYETLDLPVEAGTAGSGSWTQTDTTIIRITPAHRERRLRSRFAVPAAVAAALVAVAAVGWSFRGAASDLAVVTAPTVEGSTPATTTTPTPPPVPVHRLTNADLCTGLRAASVDSGFVTTARSMLDPAQLDRLAELLAEAGERGLVAEPADAVVWLRYAAIAKAGDAADARNAEERARNLVSALRPDGVSC